MPCTCRRYSCCLWCDPHRESGLAGNSTSHLPSESMHEFGYNNLPEGWPMSYNAHLAIWRTPVIQRFMQFNGIFKKLLIHFRTVVLKNTCIYFVRHATSHCWIVIVVSAIYIICSLILLGLGSLIWLCDMFFQHGWVIPKFMQQYYTKFVRESRKSISDNTIKSY